MTFLPEVRKSPQSRPCWQDSPTYYEERQCELSTVHVARMNIESHSPNLSLGLVPLAGAGAALACWALFFCLFFLFVIDMYSESEVSGGWS